MKGTSKTYGLAAIALVALTVSCSDSTRARSTTSVRETSDTTTSDTSTSDTTADTGPPADPAEDGGYASVITHEVVDNPSLDAFQEKVTGLAKKVDLPGVSLLVVQHGELVQQEAWGEYTLDTIVPIASGSKWLSAATIMTLVDDGTLALDAPISTYVPELEDVKGKVGTITLRQLLSFTSGLVKDETIPCTADPDSTMQACAAILLKAGVVHPPGDVFRYGGQHLYLAAAIAEHVTGVPFAELFQQRIAQPLGMAHTAFVQSGSGGQYTNVTNPNPAGGAISTLGDYGRFLEMLVHGGVAPDGMRILSEDAISEMQANQIEGAEYGTAAAFRMQLESPYGLGEWLDWTDADGDALVLSSDGAFGFRPWIDKANDLFGVYLINDRGNGYVEGNPNVTGNDEGKVHTSGNWVFEDVAEGLGGSLPSINYPNRA
ncbi:MAG: serine hydrolase domain-containing protein [Actinomycetota bacterium]|nr:serine hydrolase domain-containing protein [Actinomycetota bacterium]